MTIVISLIIFVGFFALAGIMGAPYVPILGKDSRALLDLTNLKPGQILIDLGSGDGRLLRAAAKRGVQGVGYEINPIMYLISLIVCFRYRKLIHIYLADIWHIRIPACDAVYVFLMPKFMLRLTKKFQNELTRPTTVVSYAFELPGLTAIRRNRNSFVYQIGE